MQLVDLTPPMAVSLECEPGRYLLTDANASELKAPNPDPYQNERPDWSNPPKRLLIIPPMGIGDLIFLTPSLFAIRQQYPDTEIAVCGFAASLVVLERAVEGVELLPYPVPHSALEQFDCIAIVTNHSTIDYSDVVRRGKVIVDFRNATKGHEVDGKVWKL